MFFREIGVTVVGGHSLWRSTKVFSIYFPYYGIGRVNLKVDVPT